MYPVLRFFFQMWRAGRLPPLAPFGTHVSHHLCWPWDLDLFFELNNGRTLTLFDLGRIPFGKRVGLLALLRREGWGLTVAGSVVRYRRRVRIFDRIEMRSRLIGWDARFMYIEQVMIVRGVVTSQAVFRTAVTDRSGIVPTDRMVAALAPGATAPDLPAWIATWCAAEDERPWPPELAA
jgi:acyl-CoA thioesterase FadM